MTKINKKEANKEVVMASLLALIFAGLTIFVDWAFILPTIIALYYGRKKLFA